MKSTSSIKKRKACSIVSKKKDTGGHSGSQANFMGWKQSPVVQRQNADR